MFMHDSRWSELERERSGEGVGVSSRQRSKEEEQMKKWLIAGVTVLALGFGGAALATKAMGDEVGVKSCKACHEGAPKDKKLTKKMKDMQACSKKTGKTCKGCHNGVANPPDKC
jgi:nitrate/TMAO reductase-like tetraheme cytochrome c subunit